MSLWSVLNAFCKKMKKNMTWTSTNKERKQQKVQPESYRANGFRIILDLYCGTGVVVVSFVG